MSTQDSTSLTYGPYDLSELDEIGRNFWLDRAKKNDLPPVPKAGRYVRFYRKFDSAVNDFPEMKARAVITADGKIRSLQDFDFDKHLV